MWPVLRSPGLRLEERRCEIVKIFHEKNGDSVGQRNILGFVAENLM